MINNQKKVLILMTTYNGIEFLNKQIDSIINQDFTTWNMIISDDNSTDDTFSILKKYQEADNRIRVVKNTSGKNGAFENFFGLLNIVKKEYSNYDYYLFCDQDDIWINSKLSTLISIANKEQNNSIPIAYYSDMSIINDEDTIKVKSFNSINCLKMSSQYVEFFSHRYIWGCTMMFNNCLLNMYNCPINYNLKIISHDNYIASYAALYGKLRYIDIPLVMYRRHSNNVSAMVPKYNFIDKIKRALFNWNSISLNAAKTYYQGLAFLKTQPDQYKNRKHKDLEKIITYGGIKSVFFCFYYFI